MLFSNAIFLRQQFSTVALSSLFHVFIIILHSSFLTCSFLVLRINRSSFPPRTSVSVKFACPVYWRHAECTQPFARFIRHTRAQTSAILRNFACEYEDTDGSWASFTANAFERIPRMTQFIRDYPESFPQAVCVDYFTRNRMQDVDMLAEIFKLSIDSKILRKTDFVEISKNLNRYRSENNFVELSK